MIYFLKLDFMNKIKLNNGIQFSNFDMLAIFK